MSGRRLPTLGSGTEPRIGPAEAHGDAGVQPDRARLAAGWTYRFAAEGRRAEEMIELYRSLGFEVAADPVRVDHAADGCALCVAANPTYLSIYTWRPAPEDHSR